MTPTDLETAARHACKLLDLDPDANVQTGNMELVYSGTMGHWEYVTAPRWSVMSNKIREAWAIQEGIRHAEQVKYLPPDHVLR